jgi:hypothetical protein
LQQALQRAAAAKQPFDVVHFDGHGCTTASTGWVGYASKTRATVRSCTSGR